MNVFTTAVVIILGGATCGIAAPMWESSDTWRCTMQSHIMAVIGEEPTVMDHAENFFDIDFIAGTQTSAFTDTIGQLVEKHYFAGDFGSHNVIVTSWGGSKYPITIIEKGGEYWQTTASGHADSDREIWIATYRCLPQSLSGKNTKG